MAADRAGKRSRSGRVGAKQTDRSDDMTSMKTTSAGLPITAANLSSPPLHIPDGLGGAYKTELVVERSQDTTTKINWWHGSDPRREPHNHPWPFESTIESGGYTADRYYFDHLGNVVGPITDTYAAGDVNKMPQDCFHVVRDVLPGTRTTMRIGAMVGDGEWGHLNTSTGVVTPSSAANNGFIAQLRALNPHLRQREEQAIARAGDPAKAVE